METLLHAILLTAILSLVMNIFLKKFDLPIIIGYIFAGALITQLLQLHESHRQDLFEIAEFGIVFLMFTIGLEFPLEQLKRLKREVFLLGMLQVVLSMGLFSLLGMYMFGLEQKTALVVGGALALSSTAIVLTMLQQSGDIGKPYGRQALGILLFQDLAVIPLLFMVSLFTQEDQSLIVLIGKTLFSGIVAIVIIYLFGKYVLGHYFDIVNKTKSQEIFIESIFLIVLGSAALTYWLGFSYTLGAFFAGMMISETRYKIQVEVNFVPFRDLMLGIFFISVGLQISFDFLLENIMTIVILMTAVMLIKALILFAITRPFSKNHVSLKTALTLAQVGEFSFAILELSRMEGLIDPALSQTLIIAVVFSMILTPFMLKHIDSLSRFSNEELTEPPLQQLEEEMRHHVVVIGYGKLGQHIVYHLKKRGLIYVAIDFHINLVKDGEEAGNNVKFGDATNRSVLEHLNIKDAAAVIIATHDEHRIPYLIDLLKEYRDHINVVTRVSDFSQESLLELLGSQSYVNENDVVARAMVEKALLSPYVEQSRS